VSQDSHSKLGKSAKAICSLSNYANFGVFCVCKLFISSFIVIDLRPMVLFAQGVLESMV